MIKKWKVSRLDLAGSLKAIIQKAFSAQEVRMDLWTKALNLWTKSHSLLPFTLPSMRRGFLTPNSRQNQKEQQMRTKMSS